MPGGDGTGPAGMGPMTGRAAGYCAGYSVPGYMNPIPGRGYFGWGRGGGGFGRGFGRGGGRGWRNWYWATGLPGSARAAQGLPAWGGFRGYPFYGAPYAYPYNPYVNPYGQGIDPKQEADMLKDELKSLEEEIKAINKRIEELESMPKTKEQ